ncbi:MAG: FtsQ-type POTRA domain-containing protein [Myxococcales bacterium]|nr:FtsQ-type POTRA domain-containing protein [Myxococcales bacterium]
MIKRLKDLRGRPSRGKNKRRRSARKRGDGKAAKAPTPAEKASRRSGRSLLRLLGLRRKNRRLRKPTPAAGIRVTPPPAELVERTCKSEVDPELANSAVASAELPERAAAAKGARGARVRGALVSAAKQAGRAALRTFEVLLLLAVLGGLGLAGYHGYKRLSKTQYFNVDKIVIEGARRTIPAQLRAAVDPLRGQPIFRVDTAQISRALERHPWIARVDVRRDLPRTLRVIVHERDARALLRFGSRLYLVDAQGVIFKRAQRGETEGLPLVSGLDRATLLKNRVYARLWIQRALSVIARYYAQPRPPLSEVRLGTQGELTLFLRRGGIALRFGRTFSEERLRKLDAVWRALGPKKVKRLRALLLDHEARADRVIARLSPR